MQRRPPATFAAMHYFKRLLELLQIEKEDRYQYESQIAAVEKIWSAIRANQFYPHIIF